MSALQKHKHQKPLKTEDNSDLESEPVDILVDAIIGCLEHSTAYLRAVANQAFALLSDAVTEGTIDLILTVKRSIAMS